MKRDTTTATTELAIVDPEFSDAERYALAAFLAGYRGVLGPEAVVVADARDERSVEARVKQVTDRFGRLDIPVNNADNHIGVSIVDMTEAE